MQFETNYTPIILFAFVGCSKNKNFQKDDSIGIPSSLSHPTEG